MAGHEHPPPSSHGLHPARPSMLGKVRRLTNWTPAASPSQLELQRQTMSSWAVLGAVMDDETFEQVIGHQAARSSERDAFLSSSAPTHIGCGPFSARPASAASTTHSHAHRYTLPGASSAPYGDTRFTTSYSSIATPVTAEPDSYYTSSSINVARGAAASDGYSDSATATHNDTLVDPHGTRMNGSAANVWYKPLSSVPLRSRLKHLWHRIPPLKAHHRTILKCSIAYLIASLFTFVDPLSRWLSEPFDLDGPFSSAHTIATIVTYYRPAATAGAMMEANQFALIGLIWAAVLVFGSMSTAVLLNNLDHEILSHVLILVIFVGFGYGVMAYTKQRVNKPAFGTTCSMICVVSSVIITKEGSIHLGYFDFTKIAIYSAVVLIGVAISNLVSFGLWRGSATNKLQADINSTLDGFAILLDMLIKTFLLEDAHQLNAERLKGAIDTHHSAFISLKKSLDEASYEVLEPRLQRSQEEYTSLVESMTRLAQHLGGLRSGCSLQTSLIQVPKEGSNGVDSSDSSLARVTFERFRESVGPSLNKLTGTSCSILRQLRTSFLRADGAKQPHFDTEEHDLGLDADAIGKLRPQLLAALDQFEEAHNESMKQLYRNSPTQTEQDSIGVERLKNMKKDPMITKPNEEMFLIFFFLFNLEEFVKELTHLIDVFGNIRAEEETIEIIKKQHFSLSWFFPCWKRGSHSHRRTRKRQRTWRQGLRNLVPADPQTQTDTLFPMQQYSTGSQHQRLGDSLKIKFGHWFYHALRGLDTPDMKYAIKVGVGAAVLASPAFIPRLRPIFVEYKGQWSMVSYMVVMATTVGQTNFLAMFRFGGTLVGALTAVLVYHIFWEGPVGLAISGFLLSIPCYYLMVMVPQHATTGRFLLLSYNLTCLYAYNVREDEIHIFDVAFHRVVAVFAGVAWGWFVTNAIWPYKARNELRKGLSELLFETAFLYAHLVRQYSTPPQELASRSNRSSAYRHDIRLDEDEEDGQDDDDSTGIGDILGYEAEESAQSPLLTSEAKYVLEASVAEFLRMELYLQIKLIKLMGLLSATQHEPRLKGPFPVPAYRNLLASAQTLLDTLHSMRAITTRPRWYTTVRQDFVVPVQKERRAMVGMVLLYFSVLGGAVQSGQPVAPWLPEAGSARERLVDKIRSLPVVKRRMIKGRSDYLLYFAYSIAMKRVIEELERMGQAVQELFGVIGGAGSVAEFETMFELAEHEVGHGSTSSSEEST